MRVALLAAVVLCLVAPTAAFAEPAFLEPGARAHTLAGGGTEPPGEGVPAAHADLGYGAVDFAPLPDGTTALLAAKRLWIIGRDGRLHATPPPRRSVSDIAASPDGTLYAAVTRTGRRGSFGFDALPDGSFARADGSGVQALDRAGRVTARLGRDPLRGAGDGDGGPPQRALLTPGGLAATTDGAMLVQDVVPARFDRWTRNGRPDFLASDLAVQRVRIMVPVGSGRALAAIAPATYERLATGAVVVSSAFAGDATVEVRRRGRVVARAAGPVTAGETELRLDRPPPRGDLWLALAVAAPDGRAARATFRATTLRRLTSARARGLISRFAGAARHDRIRGCTRVSPLRIDCRRVFVGRGERRCMSALQVRLLPDGARGREVRGGSACRRVGR